MRVLITGSAGFIGSNLALRLLDRGDEVIGVDCLDPYYDVSLKEARLARTLDYDGYTDVRARIEDREALAKTFQQHQPQRVVNLAAQAGVRYSIENPNAYVDSNLVGFGNILQGCREHGSSTSSTRHPVRSMAPTPRCRSRYTTTSTTPSASMPRPRRPTS
jgi:UDP-glucuronate 4-epimerase